MTILSFPPVTQANNDGLLAIGGDLEVQSLLMAYREGIFPWPISDEYPLAWFSPNPRGVLFCDNMHIGKTLAKYIRKNNFTITFNQNFSLVINQCATISRKDQNETWITPEIISSYLELFLNNMAYSVEVWIDQRIVAGIYGVCVDGNISGESMFSHQSNMSKIALVALISTLQQKGIKYLDTQMLTSVTTSMGGEYIPRSKFIQLLKDSKQKLSRNQIFNARPCLNLFLKNSK